jgi:tryptophanyl-tRNA synthetase
MKLAQRITEYLFTNGAGQKATRLVLEMKDGTPSGGWCKEAVTDVVQRFLDEVSAERRKRQRRRKAKPATENGHGYEWCGVGRRR